MRDQVQWWRRHLRRTHNNKLPLRWLKRRSDQDVWGWNGWVTCMSKTEWQHKRIASWMCSIKTSLRIGSLYRTKVLRVSVSITKHWPTTICWLDHMTMLNALTEAHAFAPLTQWKGKDYWHQNSKTWSMKLMKLKSSFWKYQTTQIWRHWLNSRSV